MYKQTLPYNVSGVTTDVGLGVVPPLGPNNNRLPPDSNLCAAHVFLQQQKQSLLDAKPDNAGKICNIFKCRGPLRTIDANIQSASFEYNYKGLLYMNRLILMYLKNELQFQFGSLRTEPLGLMVR